MLALVCSFAFAKVVPLISLSPEAHYSTYPIMNQSGHKVVNWVDSTWYESYQDLYQRYFKRDGLLNLGIKIEDDPLFLIFDLDFRPGIINALCNKNYTNIPFVGNNIGAILDLTFPRVGFAQYKTDRFFASLGRRQVKWGPSTYDFAISDSAPFLDNAYLTYTTDAGSGKAMYTFAAFGFNTAAMDDKYKTMFAHKISWSNDFLRLAVGELNMVYNQVPNILDCTPFGVWHNLYQDSKSNVLMSLSVESLIPIADIAKARLYGTYAMDDFDLPGEGKNGKPGAMGFNLGLQLNCLASEPTLGFETRFSDYALREETFGFNSGLSIKYEWYFSTPYMYNRVDEAGKFTAASRLFDASYGYIEDKSAFYIGFPYGPNVKLHYIEVSYAQKQFSAFASLSLIQRGSYNINSPYGVRDGVSLFEDPNYMDYRYKLCGTITKITKIEAGLNYFLNQAIKLNGSFTFTKDTTHNKTAVEATIGATIDFFRF